MNEFLDLSQAKQFASNDLELFELAQTFEISLQLEVDFFKNTPQKRDSLGEGKFESLWINSDLIKSVELHFHQIMGFLPLFAGYATLNELKSLSKLIINNSSVEFYDSCGRIQEILEGLQSELSNWKASYHLHSSQ